MPFKSASGARQEDASAKRTLCRRICPSSSSPTVDLPSTRQRTCSQPLLTSERHIRLLRLQSAQLLLLSTLTSVLSVCEFWAARSLLGAGALRDILDGCCRVSLKQGCRKWKTVVVVVETSNCITGETRAVVWCG